MNPTEVYHPARVPPNGSGSDAEDPQVLQAVEEYLAALEAGQAPGREEFLGQHADIAVRLREYLDGLELIHRAGSAASPVSDTEAAADDLAGAEPLGDFLLVRELGRGGMGVVYEAVQRSLNRRVALKVLPFAAALDAKQLQRFKNEAQAAAQLHHTNIVPVFGVGCERGVHFYAMQYIEGRTLAAVLAELRQEAGLEQAAPPQRLSEVAHELVSGRLAPVKRSASAGPPTTPHAPPTPAAAPAGTRTGAGLSTERSIQRAAYFRTMASLALQAAEALAYAHEEGVVHRDIKPANLLVDVKGKLWITDFGLARCRSQAGLTMTGDLVGTLRYMSPEQALAKRVLIDHRTDIYSLGVTLYELLTLEPAYRGDDREEMLRQIAFEEPRSLRRLNRSLPGELETIVLKAMEKNPAERYATAQELADDLRRFLEDKPIRAKRPTLLQRTRKWSRRHPSVVWGAAIMLALAMIGSAVGMLLIARARDVANANYQRAQENLDVAYRVLDEIYLQEAENRLPQEQALTPKDRQFLEKALGFYENFARQEGTDTRAREQTARAYLRVAGIQKQLGHEAEAERNNRQAIALFDRLASEFPGHPEFRQELALCHANMGADFFVLSSDPSRQQDESVRRAMAFVDYEYNPKKEESIRRAIALQEQLASEFPTQPEYQRDLAMSYSRLASQLVQSSQHEAEKVLRRALGIRQKLAEEYPAVVGYQEMFADSMGQLANYLYSHGRLPEAEKLIYPRLEIQKKIAADFPGVAIHRHHLAFAYYDLANWQEKAGRLPEAEGSMRQCLELHEKLAVDFPSVPVYRLQLVENHQQLASVLERTGQREAAEKHLRQAIDISTKLAADFPQRALFRCSLAESHTALANLRKEGGEQTSRAQESLERDHAIAALKEAIRLNPNDVATAHAVGVIFWRNGRWNDAVVAFRKAIELKPDYARAYTNLGVNLMEMGALEEAIGAYQEAIRINPDNAVAFNSLGYVLWKKGRWDDAVAAFRKAIELKPEDAQAYVNLGVNLGMKGAVDEAIAAIREGLRLQPDNAWAYAQLGWALEKKGARDEAITAYQEAIRLKPGDAHPWKALGHVLWTKGRWDEAVAAFRKAIELKPDYAEAYNNLGVNLLEQGAFDEAITALKEAVRLKLDYAWAYAQLARAYRHKGALDEVLAAYKEALRLQPGNAAFQDALGVALWNNDCLDEAIVAYQEALHLEPDHAVTLLNLGRAFKDKGILDDAEAAFQRGATLLERLAKEKPGELNQCWLWAISLIRLAELHRDTARSQEAEKELRQAHDLLQKLVSESPKNHSYASDLAIVRSGQAQLCLDRAELTEARRLFGEAHAAQKTALELCGNASVVYQGRVATHALELANTFLQSPKDPALTEQVEALLREAERYSANDRSAQSALAWFLATCPGPRFRDPQRAVELARRLVEQGPQKTAYWRTLGAALSGIGDGEAAIAALEKALQLQKGGDGTERFFLAMVYWNMGNQERARTCYQEAVQWMDKHKPQHAELRRLRTETATLIGMEEGK